MMRDRERCARELQLIGGAYTDAYWQRLGRPDKQIRAVQKWAGVGRKPGAAGARTPEAGRV
jgi:hypothetical protein